jgi:mono/diheme cytochrome c family protein
MKTPSLNPMPSPLRPHLLAAALLLGFTLTSNAAEGVEIFKDADLTLGENLLREHECAACHQRRVGGDGNAIYKPQGRISTPGALRGMVEYCNTQLGLTLFPEEVLAMAAVLQRDHYRFK